MRDRIDHNNMKWLWRNLETQKDVDDVSNYLKENDVCIENHTFTDNRSGMTGGCYSLEGKKFDYPYFQDDLLYYIRNAKSYIAISKTPEYNKFLKLKKKYDQVYNYLKK